MDNLILSSTNIQDNEKGNLTINYSKKPTVLLSLKLTIKNKVAFDDKQFFIKLHFDKGAPQMLTLFRHTNNLRLALCLRQKHCKDKSQRVITENSILNAEIIYLYNDEWVQVMKDINSFSKQHHIVNLISYYHTNGKLELSRALKQDCTPTLKLKATYLQNLSLNIELNNKLTQYKIIKEDGFYLIKDPEPINESSTNIEDLYVTITDEDSHKLIWFSKPISFENSLGKSFLKIELLSEKMEGGDNPIIGINDKLEILPLPNKYKNAQICIEIYKNSVYSIIYKLDKNQKQFFSETGQRILNLTIGEGDTFTIVNAKLITDDATYKFVNDTFKRNMYTLKFNGNEKTVIDQIIKYDTLIHSKIGGFIPVQNVKQNMILVHNLTNDVHIQKIVHVISVQGFKISLKDGYKILPNGIITK